jgi:prepilin-type N-terminal cleavage/methylation domain-containing protein
MNNFSKGFTLIEMVVVTGILALVIGGMTELLIMIASNNQKTKTIIALKQEGGHVITVINRKITSAISLQYETVDDSGNPINDACPDTAGTSVDTLIIGNDSGNEPLVCTSAVDGSDNVTSQLTLGGNQLINTDVFSLLSCRLTCYKKNGRNFATANFVLQYKVSGENQEFTTTAAVRNFKI